MISFLYKTSYSLIFFSCVALIFCCVFQVVSVTQEKSSVQSYQSKISAIKQERNEVLAGVSSGVSLSSVEEIARDLNFVESDAVTYIRLSSSEMVRR